MVLRNNATYRIRKHQSGILLNEMLAAEESSFSTKHITTLLFFTCNLMKYRTGSPEEE